MRIPAAWLASFTAVFPSEAHENFLEAGFPGVMRRWSQFVFGQTHTGKSATNIVKRQWKKYDCKKSRHKDIHSSIPLLEEPDHRSHLFTYLQWLTSTSCNAWHYEQPAYDFGLVDSHFKQQKDMAYWDLKFSKIWVNRASSKTSRQCLMK